MSLNHCSFFILNWYESAPGQERPQISATDLVAVNDKTPAKRSTSRNKGSKMFVMFGHQKQRSERCPVWIWTQRTGGKYTRLISGGEEDPNPFRQEAR